MLAFAPPFRALKTPIIVTRIGNVRTSARRVVKSGLSATVKRLVGAGHGFELGSSLADGELTSNFLPMGQPAVLRLARVVGEALGVDCAAIALALVTGRLWCQNG